MAERLKGTIKSLEFIRSNTDNPYEEQLLALEIMSLKDLVNELEGGDHE